ncbi:basic helix-loop-helix protein [Linnemannia zychae]|nr:basic helix-loop-helix protein [Linnemannia zychae]
MTSSSEIHVQEVLNNLSNTIKRDAEIVDGSSFTAAIAQQDAGTALPTSLAADLPVSLPVELSKALGADLPVSMTTSIPVQDQHQIGQEQLERIAQQHQQEQAQLQAHVHVEQDAQVQAQVHAVQTQVQAHVQAQVAQEQVQQQEDSHVIHVNALDSNSSTLATVPLTSIPSNAPPPAKPAPGSEEWHRIRRDNHKEVERRRREHINAGINDLAAVIPNSDKNKGAILRQAVNYIATIQEAQVKMMEDAQNVEAIKFERDQAQMAKNLAQAELQNLIAEHTELKRKYDTLCKEFDDAEENRKKQHADEE